MLSPRESRSAEDSPRRILAWRAPVAISLQRSVVSLAQPLAKIFSSRGDILRLRTRRRPRNSTPGRSRQGQSWRGSQLRADPGAPWGRSPAGCSCRPRCRGARRGGPAREGASVQGIDVGQRAPNPRSQSEKTLRPELGAIAMREWSFVRDAQSRGTNLRISLLNGENLSLSVGIGITVRPAAAATHVVRHLASRQARRDRT